MAHGKKRPHIKAKSKYKMKKFYVFLILSSIAVLSGCGSSGSTTSSKPATPGNPNNANSVTVIDTTIPPASNTATAENPIPPGFDPTGGNRNVNTAKMEAPKKLGMPAADNSEIFTELAEIPRETRIFKDHPQLLKIIKSGIPPKQTVKVYLKNGKVMDMPADQIPNLSAEPALSIINKLGIAPPPKPEEVRDAAKKRAQAEQ